MRNKDALRGLSILVRRGELTTADWFELLEARRVIIEPCLREMSLKSLGDLKIVRDQKNGHASARPLCMGAMVEKTYTSPPHRQYREAAELADIGGEFSLSTRGIFPDDDVYYNGHFTFDHIFEGDAPASGLVTRFWGLTRNGKWVTAELIERYFEQARRAGRDERLEKRSEVVRFGVTESSLEEICQFCDITPRQIWQRLGDTVEAWLEHRLSLLANAKALVKVIEREKSVLDIRDAIE